MEPIRNNRELYARIEVTRDYEEMLREKIAELPPEKVAYIKENIIERKRSCREYMRKHRTAYEDEPRPVKIDGETYVSRIPLPRNLTSIESAEGWFLDHEYMECRPSMYDCTGQLFTVWYKIIERNGRFHAYHCVSMDV